MYCMTITEHCTGHPDVTSTLRARTLAGVRSKMEALLADTATSAYTQTIMSYFEANDWHPGAEITIRNTDTATETWKLIVQPEPTVTS